MPIRHRLFLSLPPLQTELYNLGLINKMGGDSDRKKTKTKMVGVATPVSARRRTRRQWDEYYLDLHKEQEQKKMKMKEDQQNGSSTVCSESEPKIVDTDFHDVMSKDNAAAKMLRNGSVVVVDDDSNDTAKILRSKSNHGGEDDEKNKCDEMLSNDVGFDNGDAIEILRSDVDDSSHQSRQDDGDGDGGGGSSRNDVDDDDDFIILRRDENGINDQISKSGAEDDDGSDGAEWLRNYAADDTDVGIGISKSDGGDSSEDDDNVDVDDDDDENSVEILGERIGSKGFISRNEAESGSESDSSIEKCEGSRGKVQKEPQIHRDASVDSDSSEDSDGSDESGSESDSTSEDEEDELSDEDYEGEESSSSDSESSDDSEIEKVENVKHAVSGNENRTRSERKNLRKQSDSKREKDDGSEGSEHESDFEIIMERESGGELGRDDKNYEKEMEKETSARKNKNSENNSHRERRSNEHESDGQVKKRKIVNFEREGGAELERDAENDEEEKEKKKLPNMKKSARKNPEGDNEEQTQKSQNKASGNGNCTSSVPIDSASSKENKNRSLNNVEDFFSTRVKSKGEQCSMEKVILGSKKSRSERDIDLIKILMNSINSFKEKQYNIDENALAETSLPLRFRFEDEVVPSPEKSEWEKHLDSLFCDLELGLRESETDCINTSMMDFDEAKTTMEVDESPEACCRRGNHHAILDEQIGIICKYCYTVIMDIKHVLPPMHAPTGQRRDKRYYYDEFQTPLISDIQFEGPASATPDSTHCTKGTVWDLIPGVERELYPHQREGFEFMWRNIAGHTKIEELKHTLGDDAKGCIIAHAPGTGKSRLTIVFLQSFLKLYPTCSPMIIAPKGMLLTWKDQFKKWNCNAAFHNLNTKELSGKENAVAAELLGQVENGKLSKDCIKLLKLYSWAKGGTILGISYSSFRKLTQENGKGEQHDKIREVLLERTGLLVLDEGHTPRNDKSLIWKALNKVQTQRRVLLSGTLFQNNIKELYNTLCVVNPKFADQESDTSCKHSVARRRWRKLANSTGLKRRDALKLRAVLEPFVHVHNGTILEESLPGLSHTLVFLSPTESQKTLLRRACKEDEIFRRIRMVSLISVHPSINAVTERYSSRREDIKSDIEAGVKARFLFKLVEFADALKERVLVFSQFLSSLNFIKEQLESKFSWSEGKEVLYMDGQLDERKRQESISCFNDEKSEAKVILASERACSEGISLIGASRVVLLDTVWNPSVEKQAISRAYRIGQKRVVYVYRLFTSGIEVRQYAQQIHKERISQWLFALGEEQEACESEKARADVDDKVLGAMLEIKGFNHIFEDIISQPKDSDLIQFFGLDDKN